MDPASIAASVVALLSPYLKETGEYFVGEAGKLIQDKAKTIWQKLRAKLDGDPSAKDLLDQSQKDPEANASAFKARVEAAVEADRPMAEEFSAGLAEIKAKAP